MIFIQDDDKVGPIILAQVLPGCRDDAQLRLDKVDQELAEMEAIDRQAERSATRWTNAILFAGYVYAFSHIVVFSYLTFWELSWDVMEPIAYIVGLCYSFIAYTYFLVSRGQVMDLEPLKTFWGNKFKVRGDGWLVVATLNE